MGWSISVDPEVGRHAHEPALRADCPRLGCLKAIHQAAARPLGGARLTAGGTLAQDTI